MTRIIRYQRKQYELQPEGVCPSRLVEIKDLEPGMNANGEEKRRVRFVWEALHKTTSSGAVTHIWQTFNWSLHPKSFLSQAIRDMTGTDPGGEFDLDSLLGIECDLVLKHNTGKDGRTYCNVRAIIRLPTAAEAAEEKRVASATAKVKQPAAQPRSTATVAAPAQEGAITDEDIPL